MSLNRTISWSSALRDMRNDRAFVVPPANLSERLAREGARQAGIRTYTAARMALTSAKARPLVTTAGYDRAAIMSLANAIVREQTAARAGRSHRALIGAALKQAWALAQAARRAAAH